MGHTVEVHGRIEIHPPIPWGAFNGSKFYAAAGRPGSEDLQFEVVERNVDTPDGVLLQREAVAIVARDGECRGNRIGSELQEIATWYGPGHTFMGRLDVRWPGFWSDEAPEQRFKIVDEVAVCYVQEIRWPAESE